MNLHSVVRGAIGVINPPLTISIQVSTGSTTNADGSRSPAYATTIPRRADVQPLQYTDIVQADGLSIQGVRRKIYIHGEVDGLVRADNKGGDLITLPDSSVWKVAVIAEQWPGWCAAICTLQDNS